MKTSVAYLVNQYPMVSLSFIRREIVAIEAQGMSVARFSIRPTTMRLVDEADRLELEQTRAILGAGMAALLGAAMATLITRPLFFVKAMAITIGLGRRSDRGVMRHLAYLAEACLLRRWLARDRIQHLHVHFATNSTTVAMLCRILGGPGYSFTMHGSACFDKIETIGIEQKVAASRFVVAVSQYGCSQIYRYIPHAHWHKVKLIHCGVDSAFVNQQPLPLSDRPRLVCVGRLVEQKGQILLIEAAARLKKQGLNMELVLVGDGPMRKTIEQLIQKHNLKDRVRITGWASNEQVRQQLLEARAMVLPSFCEGLPVVIMESLAMGRPVISTYIAGIPELLRHKENGWLVFAGCIDSLVDAMRQAIEMDIQKLNDMGRSGRELVLHQHNASTEAGKLIELFRSAIADSDSVEISPSLSFQS